MAPEKWNIRDEMGPRTIRLQALAISTTLPDTQLWCQKWSVQRNHPIREEGTFCSLHKNKADLYYFDCAYWRVLHEKNGDIAPGRYARAAEHPPGYPVKAYECSVDKQTYKKVWEADFGMWSDTVPKETLPGDMWTVIPPEHLKLLQDGMNR